MKKLPFVIQKEKIYKQFLCKNISGRLQMATHIPWLLALFPHPQGRQQQVELFSHHTILTSSASLFHI